MALLARTWINLARVRRRFGRPQAEASHAARRQWVRDHAPGHSFADIGGLFALHGEVAFVAEEAGATRVTEFDGGDAVLSEFEVRRRERDSKVRFVQGDLEDPEAVARVGAHDIVWCSGVIYHTPNPVRQLLHLRSITRQLLYLGSHTIPEIPGFPQACIYYPYLPEPARRAFVSAHARPENCWAVGTPFNDEPMLGHGNFWWALTPSAVEAMLRTARFEVVERIRHHASPFLTDFVARPIDRAPILPPLEYYRLRGEARARGEDPGVFATYYDEHPESWQPRPPSEDARSDDKGSDPLGRPRAER